ncbi:hypothetical protein BDK51DRAFT_50736 [Blyttiomyces helicus]|uniref:Uncharacterized protein n=1 Tax=Blyttiomyces helicus TaxID=388810 RepID=A0A4V1IQ00_9FUNG|nr:hypothetical protein BDK51DRAFT_50736 [Blyttiomyces helicus]|eukprot:RKO84827.1 hypothetical protein BDK51DRAFT_50736 [Blyttiomyces helicus]
MPNTWSIERAFFLSVQRHSPICARRASLSEICSCALKGGTCRSRQTTTRPPIRSAPLSELNDLPGSHLHLHPQQLLGLPLPPSLEGAGSFQLRPCLRSRQLKVDGPLLCEPATCTTRRQTQPADLSPSSAHPPKQHLHQHASEPQEINRRPTLIDGPQINPSLGHLFPMNGIQNITVDVESDPGEPGEGAREIKNDRHDLRGLVAAVRPEGAIGAARAD